MKFVDYKFATKNGKNYYILTVVFKPARKDWAIRTYFLTSPLTNSDKASPLCDVEVKYNEKDRSFTACITG